MRRALVIRPAVALLIGAAVLLAACGQPDPEPADHDQALRRLAAQLTAGRDQEAIRDLREYLDRAPADAVMHYNLACLEARTGDAEAALRELRLALRHGYRRLEQIRRDRDLAPLHGDPRFEALLGAHADSLRAVAEDAAIDLVGDAWSDPLDLGAGATARVRVTREALEVQLPDLPEARGAWVVVAVPTGHAAWETDRWFEFAIVRDDGGFASRPPTASVTGDVIAVPWRALVPHRPPLDLLLGLNVGLATDTGRRLLVGDPWLGRSDVEWRRYAPLRLDPGEDPAPLLVARPDTRLAVGDSLGLELALQGVPDGDVAVTVAAGGARAGRVSVPVDLGLGYATALVTFTAPPAGWCTLRAEALAHDLAWEGRVYRLDPTWFLEQNARLSAVPAAERDIVRFWLYQVLRGQQTFDPRDDPAGIAAAVTRTEALLARHDATGTVLPAEAVAMPVAVRAGPDALMAARLVLPPESRRGTATRARVVLVDTEDAMVSLAGDLAGAAAGVTLVLVAPPLAGADEATAGQVLAARAWLARLLPDVGDVALVGAGRAATSAVLAASADPAAWSSLRLWADASLDPWPLVEAVDLPATVPDAVTALAPVTALPREAGLRAIAVAEALGGTVERRAGDARLPDWLAR